MPRTMSEKDYEKFAAFVDKKEREETTREDAIAFLRKIGYEGNAEETDDV